MSREKADKAKTEFVNKLAANLEKSIKDWGFKKPVYYDDLIAGLKVNPVTADLSKLRDYLRTSAATIFRNRADAFWPGAAAFFTDMTAITGISPDWLQQFELTAMDFKKLIMPESTLNPYDARINIPKKDGKDVYDLTFYEDEAFKAGIDAILRGTFDYHSKQDYKASNMDLIPVKWNFQRDAAKPYSRSSLPDLAEILNYDPSVKMFVLHGYYDLVTPFYQSELDLVNVGLADRILVRNFEGGHMTYESEEARAPMKQELDKFYGASSVLALQ